MHFLELKYIEGKYICLNALKKKKLYIYIYIYICVCVCVCVKSSFAKYTYNSVFNNSQKSCFFIVLSINLNQTVILTRLKNN